MKAHIFQDAMTSSTRVFGRKQVSVVFAGDQAKTDGTTVYLPSLPSAAEVGNAEADVMRGYRSHEAMHVRITDTSSLMMEALKKLMHQDEFAAKLVNYIEDLRIENAGVQEYSGMRADLEAVNIRAAEEMRITVEAIAQKAGMPLGVVLPALRPEVQLGVALMCIGRKRIGIGGGFYEEATPLLRKEIVDFATKLAGESLALTTGIDKRGSLNERVGKTGTQEAFDLAVRAVKEFRDLVQAMPQPQPPQPPQPQPDDMGEQGDGGNDGDNGGGRQAIDQHGDSDSDDGDGDGDGDDSGDGDGDADADADADGGGGGDGDGDEGDGGGGGGTDEEAGDEGGDGAGGGGEGADGGGGDDTDGGDGSGNGPQTNDESSGAPSQDSRSSGGGAGTMDYDALLQEAEKIGDADYRDALSGVLRDIKQRAGGSDGTNQGTWVLPWRPFSTAAVNEIEIEKEFDWANDYRTQGWVDNYHSMRAAISSKQAMIRRVLEQELQARFDRRWQPGFTSGRLNNGLLADAVSGRESVYRQREDGRDMDTFLRLHIDSSASMGRATGSKMWQATMLAISMCEALERTGCEIAVSTWGFNHGLTKAQGAAMTAHQGDYSNRQQEAELHHQQFIPVYTSAGCGTIITYKTASQRMVHPTTRARFGKMASSAGGGTPLIDTLLPAVRDMTRLRHGKRILVVMTDGEPDGCVEKNTDHAGTVARAMADIHEECRRSGVHLIGVGVVHSAQHLFADHVHVRTPDDYALVMQRIASFLRQERTNAYRVAA